MGAFLYLRRTDIDAERRHESAAEKALSQMRARGLQAERLLKRANFELHVYRKRRFSTENVLEFENQDFIVATGTLIYRQKTGRLALASLYEDFVNERLSFENALGHFAVWVYVAGRLSLFTDFQGMYQVYRNAAGSIISNSFLALHAGCETRTPNPQEIYEYLCFSQYYGANTVLAEISRMDHRFVHELHPRPGRNKKQINLPDFDPKADFQTQVERTAELLGEYFSALADTFGDDQSLGLSGGLDSRLTLAFLRRSGVNPRVYVQGPDDSADVRVAKAIAQAGGFAIEHDRFEAKPEFSRDDFPQRLQSGYNYIDGFNPSGLFNGWSLSADERSQVPRPERLRLYGMAGEMYRRNLALPNRFCTFREFLTVQADKADCSAFTAAFSKRSVYDSVGDKIVEALQLRERRLTPEQTELCYPHFRLAANSGWQMTVQNERAHALIPYGEPVLSYPSGKIQMKFRDLARFEAALIEYADPVLAAVTSNYGHAFDQPPGWRARLRARTLHLVPIRMRPVIQRQRARFRRPASLPFYLQADYLSVVFPEGFPLMSPYVDISAIKDPLMLSRALSLELLLNGKLSV